jgi:hypothetical protein
MSFDKKKWNIEQIMYNMIFYSFSKNKIDENKVEPIRDVIDIICEQDVYKIEQINDIRVDKYYEQFYSSQEIELSKNICFDFLDLVKTKIINWEKLPYIVKGTPEQNKLLYEKYEEDILKILNKYF